MSATGRRAPGDSLHVDRVGVFFNLCKVIIHLQPKPYLWAAADAFESRMDIFGEMPDFSFTRLLRACRVIPRRVLVPRSLRKRLEIKASLRQAASRLLWKIGKAYSLGIPKNKLAHGVSQTEEEHAYARRYTICW